MAHTEIIIDEDGNMSIEGVGFKDNTCSLDSALIAGALEAEVDTKTEKAEAKIPAKKVKKTSKKQQEIVG